MKINENHLYLDLLKKTLTASIYEESAWSIVEMDRTDWRQDINIFRLLKNFIKHQIVQYLDSRSYLLVKKNSYDPVAREDGRDWPQMLGYTMIGVKRLDNLQSCIENILANRIPGDFIETGVWRGGATIFMRAMLKHYRITDRLVWVADSFEGLPSPKSITDGHDLSSVRHLKISSDEVKKNFQKFGLLDDQVRFLEGWFSETLPKFPGTAISILRLDGDMYSSTMDALDALYPKVSMGGYVIVDDYYSWNSCREAVSDYLNRHNLNPQILAIDGDAAFWKVGA